MTEQIYGHLPADRFHRRQFDWAELECLKVQRADGVLLLDPKIGDKHVQLGQWCRQAGLSLVLGFTDSATQPDEGRLERAMAITRRLAIGNTKRHEWRDKPGRMHDYLDMASRRGFEWICTITQNSLLRDSKRGGVLRELLESTLCLCLCGHAVAGHLFKMASMPDRHVVNEGRKGVGGVSIESLREYLQPLTILSGTGGQRGLHLGSRIFAKKLGFKGLIVSIPFNLEGTDRIPGPPGQVGEARAIVANAGDLYAFRKRICRACDTKAKCFVAHQKACSRQRILCDPHKCCPRPQPRW